MAVIDIKDLVKDYQIYSRRGQRLKEVAVLGRKSYHDTKRALDGVTAQVAKGECLGIIGDNGSGKSTLLKILAGTTHATSGEARVAGRISYILDPSTGFNGDFSGRENVLSKCSFHGLSPTQARDLMPEILEFSGLGERLDHPFKTYSTGMQIRLGFSVAIHIPFDVLVVDEILAVGDFLFQRKCIKAIRDFRDAGKTIVITSHNLSDVASFCDRLILLKDGAIAMTGRTEEVIQAYVEDCERRLARIEAPLVADPVLQPPVEKIAGAEIIEVSFHDDLGHARTRFKPGEAFVARMRFRTRGLLPDPCIRLQFFRNDGLLVGGINNHRLGSHYRSIEGVFDVEMRLDSINLLGGDYFCNVGIWPDEYPSWVARAPYDTRDFQFIVSIEQERVHGAGLAYSPARFRLDKLDLK